MNEVDYRLILVVDDCDDDVLFIRRAFQRASCRNPLLHINSGDEALDYLRRQGQYQDPESSPRPGVVLLDLNMPGTGGRAVLRSIKADPGLARLPIIVLTTSDDPRDIDGCYAEGANSYIVKPVEFERRIPPGTYTVETRRGVHRTEARFVIEKEPTDEVLVVPMPR